MYSPNNKADDANTISYNVVWPVRDVAQKDAIYRDYLQGYTEAQFRSARLYVWFNTPDNYYKNSLEILRKKENVVDVLKENERIQNDFPLRGSLQQSKVKVFTEDQSLMSSLTDIRFEFSDFEGADVFWLLGLERRSYLKKV